MSTFKALFDLYNQFGLFTGIWTVIRVFILPYKKIEELVPKKGSVIDIDAETVALPTTLHIVLLKGE